LKESKAAYNRNTSTPTFIVALFTVVKSWKQPKCPSKDEWIKKMCIYTHCHQFTKKNEIIGFFQRKEWNWRSSCEKPDSD
jgi:hypothetical protein